jgi:Uncharacterized conserved protein
MKIALPTKEDGTIDNHFGHCQFYTICTLDENNQVEKYEKMDSPVGCGCKSNIATTLKNMGVKVMLAGDMGEGAVNVLKSNDIKVIRGCSGKTEAVVSDYLNGNIKDSGIVCAEHEHECESSFVLPKNINLK